MRLSLEITKKRRQHLVEYLTVYPNSTIQELRNQLIVHFGYGMNNPELYKLRREILADGERDGNVWLSPTTKLLIEAVKVNPHLRDVDLALKVGLKERQVRNYLRLLRSSGIIKTTRCLSGGKIVRTVVVLQDAVSKSQVSQQGNSLQGSKSGEGNPEDDEDMLGRCWFDPWPRGNVGSD